MVIGLFTFLHVVVCFLLILVVLLQKGKGQDFASTFGGGGTQTAFGARSGATILHRATTAAAIIFMVTPLTLTILMSRSGQDSSVLGGDVAPLEITLPEPIELELPEVGGDDAEALDGGGVSPDVESINPDDVESDQED